MTSRPSETREAYAGLVSRMTGLVIDVAFLTVAALAVSTLPPLAYDKVLGQSPDWLTGLSNAVAVALPWLYFTVCWWLSGQTLGGLVVGAVLKRDRGRYNWPDNESGNECRITSKCRG